MASRPPTATIPWTILAATSGDTGQRGSARVHGVPNTRVVILYTGRRSGRSRKAAGRFQRRAQQRPRVYEVAGRFERLSPADARGLSPIPMRQSMRPDVGELVNVRRLCRSRSLHTRFSPVGQAGQAGGDCLLDAERGISATSPREPFFAKRACCRFSLFIAATNIQQKSAAYLETGRYETPCALGGRCQRHGRRGTRAT